MFDLPSRVRALTHQFPLDWTEWYKGRRADHAARAVLASLLVDLTAGRSIDDEATRAHVAILGRLCELMRERPTVPGITGDIEKLLEAGKHDREQTRRMIGRAVEVTAAEGSNEIEWLHRVAVGVELWANEAYQEAYLANLGDAGRDADDQPEDTDLVAGIAEALRDDLPRSTVGSPQQLPGGFSKLTLTCEVDGRPLVVRADRGGTFSGASVSEEFAVIKILYEAGAPVPRPLRMIPASAGRHLGFMTMSRVDGAPFGFLPEFRDRALCRELGTVLAGIHGVPLTRLPNLHGGEMAVPDRVLADVSRRERAWRESGCSNPVIEYALHWLRRNAAWAKGSRCLVHGDFRPHNILRDGDRITAVLDWEYAKVGHAAEDLAYMRDAAEALWSWDEFLDAYVEAGGELPDPQVLRYYDVYAAIFVLTILEQVEELFTGAVDQPLFMMGSVIQHRPRMLATLADRLNLPATAPARALERIGGRADSVAGDRRTNSTN